MVKFIGKVGGGRAEIVVATLREVEHVAIELL